MTLLPQPLQWGQSLEGIKLLALLQHSGAYVPEMQELSGANSELSCFIISPQAAKSQVLNHWRNGTVLIFPNSRIETQKLYEVQVWFKFSSVIKLGIFPLSSPPPSFFWTSSISESPSTSQGSSRIPWPSFLFTKTVFAEWETEPAILWCF